MTEQIYYNMWGSESEEHKDYFYKIGTIASWIGYALIGPRHIPYSTEIQPLSNICVLQTKEKFGSPRVYVSFSAETELEDAKHYRQVYKTSFELFPQYEKSIREGMDYPEYLFEIESELDKYIVSRTKWLREGRANGNIDNAFFLDRMDQIEKRKEFIKKVCNFTWQLLLNML